MRDSKSLLQMLKTIEGLCILSEELYKPSAKKYKKLIDDIYCIAHLEGGCKNPHMDWRKNYCETRRSLIKGGIIRNYRKNTRKITG